MTKKTPYVKNAMEKRQLFRRVAMTRRSFIKHCTANPRYFQKPFADAVTVERIAEARREDLATKRRSNRQRRKQHTGDSELVHSATSEANRNDDTVVQGKEACSNQSRKEDNVPLLHGQDSHNDDGANEEHDVRDRPRLITKQDVVAKTGDYQQQQRLQIGYSRYQQQLAVLSNMEEDYVRQIEHVFERQQAQGLCLDVEKALKMRKEAVQSAFDEVRETMTARLQQLIDM